MLVMLVLVMSVLVMLVLVILVMLVMVGDVGDEGKLCSRPAASPYPRLGCTLPFELPTDVASPKFRDDTIALLRKWFRIGPGKVVQTKAVSLDRLRRCKIGKCQIEISGQLGYRLPLSPFPKFGI